MVTRCHATNPICQTEVENETNKYNKYIKIILLNSC